MKAHTDAVKARIEEITALAAKTYVSTAPRDAQGKLPKAPYVVIHPANGVDTQDRFSGPLRAQHPHFTILCVGTSANNAATINEKVKAKFITPGGFGIPLVVAGWANRKPRWSEPQPIQVDNDEKPPSIYTTAELDWDSDPA